MHSMTSPLESPWTARRSNQSILKSWVFTGRTDIEAKTPILWPPDMKSWLIWKDPDAKKDWGQEEKGTTKDEMAGWHHQLNGHEFWVDSRSWWWTERPGVLWFMGSQRVRHDWVTELNWMTSPNIPALPAILGLLRSCQIPSILTTGP